MKQIALEHHFSILGSLSICAYAQIEETLRSNEAGQTGLIEDK